jgi:hypothetical protein
VLEPPPQELSDLQVSFTELGLDLLEQRSDLALGEGHDLGADRSCALSARDLEGARQHPGAVRMQNEAAATEGHRAHAIDAVTEPAR